MEQMIFQRKAAADIKERDPVLLAVEGSAAGKRDIVKHVKRLLETAGLGRLLLMMFMMVHV